MSTPSLLDEDLETPILSDSQPGTVIPPAIFAQPAIFSDSRRHRHISSQARKALKKLDHVIEYVTDEFVFEGGPFHSSDARVEALQILTALNHQIYVESPTQPTFGERVKASFVRLKGKLSIS
jgi:hypothetical protein